jgi:adenylate cyclase class IV
LFCIYYYLRMTQTRLKFELRPEQATQIAETLKQYGYASSGKEPQLILTIDNHARTMSETNSLMQLEKSGENWTITYGGKEAQGELKYEAKISDGETMVKIFNRMDYFAISSQESRVNEFRNGNGLVVLIREMPFADFAEVGGDENNIKELLSQLGLSAENNLSDSYEALFYKWRKTRGLKYKYHMRFLDFDK